MKSSRSLLSLLMVFCLAGVAWSADPNSDKNQPAEKAEQTAAAEDNEKSKEPAEAPAVEAPKPAEQAKEKAPAEAEKKQPAAPAQKKPAEESAANKTKAKPVSFRAEVAPILVKKCQACHGTDDPQGEFQLHTFEKLMTPGATTLASITPGDVDDSEVLRLIASDDEGERMPMDGEPLSAAEIDVVRRWIAEGAKFDGGDPTATLASILPRQAHPGAPEKYRVPIAITALDFSPNGELVAAAGYHEITLWNAADGSLAGRLSDVEQRVYSLAFSPDGKQLAVAGGTPGQSGEIAIYDPAAKKFLRALANMSDVAFDVAFSPDGKKLAAAAADRSIRIFDVASGKQEQLIEDHADWVMAVSWSPDGKRLASASRDKTSKVFDVASGDSLTTFPGHNEPVLGVAFSADGKQVYTAAADKRVRIWNPEDGKEAANISGWGGDVYQVLIADETLFSCSADKTARQHQLKDNKQLRSLTGHADSVYTLAYHAKSKRLATGSYDGEIRIWNAADGALIKNFVAAPGYARPEVTQTTQK